MNDGSFVPLGKAGQKVVIELDTRRPATRKALAEELEKARQTALAEMSTEELAAQILAIGASKSKDALALEMLERADRARTDLMLAMNRLARYSSINQCVAYVEGLLLKMGGGK